jgi:decaprenylphospho-beta-D-ribofuranose 2-oxidase
VNAHGKDPRFGSIIESVNWFKLITADGKEITCSLTEHPEIFRSAIGGMGLFGIMTEVNLKTEKNHIYNYDIVSIPTSELISKMESATKNSDTELIEAHLSMGNDHFLDQALLYTMKKTTSNTAKDDVSGENSIWLRKAIYQLARSGDFGQQLRWWAETEISPIIDAKSVTRNTAMAVPARFLEIKDPQTTDILQEYFVPTDKVKDYLETYKRLLLKYDIQILNCTIRKTNKDTNALVSYAQSDMYGFVCYYKINTNEAGQKQMENFTRELTGWLIQNQGTVYLAYRPYNTVEQSFQMYPQLHSLFALKKTIDPDNLFTNRWYEFHNIQ